MKILALDISTKTGLAVVNLEKENRPSVIFTTVVTAPDGMTGMRRVGAIAQQIMEIIEEHKPDKVWMEGYGVVNYGESMIKLIEIGTLIRYSMYLVGRDYQEAKPTSIKKFVTGKGNAQKDMMMKEVYKRWGFDTNSNDIADAVGIAMFGLAVEGLITNMPAVSMEAISAWISPKPKPKKKKKPAINA